MQLCRPQPSPGVSRESLDQKQDWRGLATGMSLACCLCALTRENAGLNYLVLTLCQGGFWRFPTLQVTKTRSGEVQELAHSYTAGKR